MKILFVSNVADRYGAGRSLLRLASRLAADGHEVEVILPEEGPLGELLRQAGIRTNVCPNLAILRRRLLGGPAGWLRLLAQTCRSMVWLVREIRSFWPDLVHSNSAVILPGGLAAKLCRVPHLWHVREFLAGENPLWAVYQWYMALVSERILCISDAVRRQFCGVLRKRKTLLVDNGIPAEECAPPAAERVWRIQQRLGEAKIWIGVAGRIQLEQKGQDVFVQAAAKLAGRHPEAGFVIVGSPFPGNEEHESRLRRLIQQLGLEQRVVLAGEVEDMPAAFAAVDVWVLPARKPEGLGNVLIEAMAMGKPVVGSAVGGIPELITDHENGFLVPPHDPEALAKAIERLIEDPALRKRMGEVGRSRFLEDFEFGACYRKMWAAYQAALAAPGIGQPGKRAVIRPERGAGVVP